MLKDDPDLEDALDGLMNAAVYASDQLDDEELCRRISDCYQEVGATAVEEDFDKEDTDALLRELGIDPDDGGDITPPPWLE